MAWGHKIWDRIHIWEQSVDFGELPDDQQAIENKWIFMKKIDTDGNITVYKAQLVAKGFWQRVNYDETFSRVATLKSIWIMLAVAAFYEIWQMDVKTTFINGFLKEEMYMMQPEGLSILKVLTTYASSSDPSMDWCKHLGVGIYALISWPKHIVLYRLAVKPVFTRKWVGALQHFW